MEVIRGLENVERVPEGCITVGSFDGLHLGHQRIIQQMRKLDLPVSVVTFDPHPQSVLRSRKPIPPLLTGFDERIGLFEKIGVDRLIVIEFTREFAEISPEDFIKTLYEVIGLKHFFIGPRHKFGKERKGDEKLLRKFAGEMGFEVHIVDPVSRFGELISSTRIRQLLQEGDALTAWRCLGRPFYLDGKVVKGDARGKKLGFPTANIKSTEQHKISVLPGIYSTVTEVEGIRWPSVSHFGPRPTFKGAKPALETHIIGFKGDIYGRHIRIGLIDRLRDIAAFHSPGELVSQMRHDARDSIQRLAELGFGRRARLRIQRFGRVL